MSDIYMGRLNLKSKIPNQLEKLMSENFLIDHSSQLYF